MPDQKPWERDWSGVTPDATGGKKPWERDWSGTSTPDYKPSSSSEDDWGLREFLLGGSKGPGGSFAKATQALPESVAGVVRGVGHAVMHPIETGQALWDEVLGGFPKLREDYGSTEAALKKFEKDPAGFLLDFYTAGRGSAGLARKSTELGVKGTRKIAPTVLGATSKASAEDLRLAGEAAREGGMPQAEYARGRAGEPLLSERQPVTHETGVPTVADLPMRKQLEAREALGRQREAAQAELRPYGEAGRRLGEKGADPAAVIAAGLAGGRIGTAIAAGAGSPRTAGAVMQGLGRTERRLAGRPLVTRADIAAAAADLLKDKEQKKQLQPHEPKILRQARRSDASSVTLQRARQILAGRTPQMRIETGFADLPDGSPTRLTVRPEQGGYGGSEGGQSTDATSGVVSRQEGGPVTAGRAYSVGDAPGASADTPKPETFVPDAPKGASIEELWKAVLHGRIPHDHGKKPKGGTQLRPAKRHVPVEKARRQKDASRSGRRVAS